MLYILFLHYCCIVRDYYGVHFQSDLPNDPVDIYEVPVTAEEIAQASKHEIGHGRTYRIRLRRRTYALKKLHIISRVDHQVLQDCITEIVNKQRYDKQIEELFSLHAKLM